MAMTPSLKASRRPGEISAGSSPPPPLTSAEGSISGSQSATASEAAVSWRSAESSSVSW